MSRGKREKSKRVEEEEEELDRFSAMTFDHLFCFNWPSLYYFS
jgi:hypothetical protein